MFCSSFTLLSSLYLHLFVVLVTLSLSFIYPVARFYLATISSCRTASFLLLSFHLIHFQQHQEFNSKGSVKSWTHVLNLSHDNGNGKSYKVVNFDVTVKQFHQTGRSPRTNLLKMKRTYLATCHLSLTLPISLTLQYRDVEEHPSLLSSLLLVPTDGLSITLASCGRRRATCMAVSPSSSSMLTSAPSSTSSCTNSVWPCVTASWSGVWLRLFRMLMSQRPCRRRRRAKRNTFFFVLQQKHQFKWVNMQTYRQLASLMRISATSLWLLRAARCSAEKPSSFFTSTSCRARARIFSVALPAGQKHNTQLATSFLTP